MPETPTCIYCHKTVRRGIDDYTIPNKGEASKEYWQYAHMECHDREESLHPQEISKGICILAHLPSAVWEPHRG